MSVVKMLTEDYIYIYYLKNNTIQKIFFKHKNIKKKYLINIYFLI